MTNHHKIAAAINAVGKSEADALEKYIALGMAISSLIDEHPGVESERAAVRAVMKMQTGDLAAEITTQLAESSLRLACLLFREAEFIEDNGATTIKAARDAITKRNNAGKPPKAPKPPKVETTPETEEARAAVGKLEAHLNAARLRADKAESELFEVVAERDKLRALLTTAGDIEALMAERDNLARRVQQLQELVAGIPGAPEPEPEVEVEDVDEHLRVAVAEAKRKLPKDIKVADTRAWNKWLAAYTENTAVKVVKKGGGYVVTEDGERLNHEPLPTAKDAVAEAVGLEFLVAADNVTAHTDRLRTLTGDANAVVERDGTAYRITYNGRTAVCASAVRTLNDLEAGGAI